MTTLELAVLIGIVAAFTVFAAVLAWVTWAQGKSYTARGAIPARAVARPSRQPGRWVGRTTWG